MPLKLYKSGTEYTDEKLLLYERLYKETSERENLELMDINRFNMQPGKAPAFKLNFNNALNWDSAQKAKILTSLITAFGKAGATAGKGFKQQRENQLLGRLAKINLKL